MNFKYNLKTIYSLRFGIFLFVSLFHITALSQIDPKNLRDSIKKITSQPAPNIFIEKKKPKDTLEIHYNPYIENLKQTINNTKIPFSLPYRFNWFSQNNGFRQISEESFYKYENKIIRNITIRQIEVFGASVNDTIKRRDSWLKKAANSIHFETPGAIIKENLFINEYDVIEPHVLADNERILRALPYIEDARIVIQQNRITDDSVDVVVITKDLWPIGFGLQARDVNSGEATIWNKNIFSFGHETQFKTTWMTKASPLLGYEGSYKIPNILGTFIRSNIRYKSNYRSKIFLIDLKRDFLTTNIKYAGGLTFSKNNVYNNLLLPDTILLNSHIKYDNFNLWLGRIYPIAESNFLTRRKKSIMVAINFSNNNFFERPIVQENLFHKYHNSKFFLATVALSSQGYYKSKLIHNYGNTEDIPYGYLLQLYGGYEINEFYKRVYLGIGYSYGYYLWKNGGYLYNYIRAGGFINKSYMQQGIIAASTRYFSKLFSLNRFKLRLYLSGNYILGINRFEDEYLSIENQNGIYGLKSNMLNGTKKLNIRFEVQTFTPYYLYGFRLALFANTDMGFISPESEFLFNQKLYTGIGAGIRLKNERLAINTLQIKIATYPIAPQDKTFNYIQISGTQAIKPSNFFITTPKIFEYK